MPIDIYLIIYFFSVAIFFTLYFFCPHFPYLWNFYNVIAFTDFRPNAFTFFLHWGSVSNSCNFCMAALVLLSMPFFDSFSNMADDKFVVHCSLTQFDSVCIIGISFVLGELFNISLNFVSIFVEFSLISWLSKFLSLIVVSICYKKLIIAIFRLNDGNIRLKK